MPGIDTFVAIGDSFTEGLNDPDPGGGFRGWADRVAGALSAQRPGFRYANLAVRGCRVLIFTGFDPRMFPVIRLLRGRIAAYDMHLRGIADSYGCDLVDLWSMRALKDARAWSQDRLHLTTEGHRHVALHACQVLDVFAGRPAAEDGPPPPPAARPLSPPNHSRWLAARRQDALWARQYAAPWVRRRLGGGSSGDGVLPKRPDLLPV